jgi:hypothetical protein
MSDYYQDIAEQAERQRQLEATQAAYEAQQRRDEQQAAAERAEIIRQGDHAHRLIQDEALWALVMSIRTEAADQAIAGPDAKIREEARLMTLAIDRLYSLMRDRLATALSINEAKLNERRYE